MILNKNFVGLDTDINLKTSIDYLRNEKKYEFVMSDCGISASKDYYNENFHDQNPIDTILLSVYMGQPNPEDVGPPLFFQESMDKLFNLTYRSEALQTLDHNWCFVLMNRKSQRELQKIKELQSITTPEQLKQKLQEEAEKHKQREFSKLFKTKSKNPKTPNVKGREQNATTATSASQNSYQPMGFDSKPQNIGAQEQEKPINKNQVQGGKVTDLSMYKKNYQVQDNDEITKNSKQRYYLKKSH